MAVCQNCGTEFKGARLFCNERCRIELKAKAKGIRAFRNDVARRFQKMIRAEAGARPAGKVLAVDRNVQLIEVERKVGFCVCVTCGKVLAWNSGIKGMHTGHFVASRRPSVLFEENNVAPQCSNCNFYQDGKAAAFRVWMQAVRGDEVIEELEIKRNSLFAHDRDQLIDMWIQYGQRLQLAERAMKNG